MMLRQEVFNSLASGSRSVRAHVFWASVMATMASSNCNPQPIENHNCALSDSSNELQYDYTLTSLFVNSPLSHVG